MCLLDEIQIVIWEASRVLVWLSIEVQSQLMWYLAA